MGSFKYRNGFTLVEMLVVLVITSLIVMILLQALQQVMSLHTRFGSEIDRNRGQAISQEWLSQLLEGLQPEQDGGKYVFKGSASELSGLSTSVPTDQYGGLTHFSLKLNYDSRQNETVLEYRDDLHSEQPLRLADWDGDSGRFVYQDSKQAAYSNWPPELDHSRQIPALIKLEARRDGRTWMMAVKPAGPENARIDVRKFISGIKN